VIYVRLTILSIIVADMARCIFASKTKTNNMSNLLYLIAIILIILWAVGYLGYNAGGLIHILLGIAIVAILLRLISGKDIFNSK